MKQANPYKGKLPYQSEFSHRWASWANNHMGWAKMKKTNKRIAKRRLKQDLRKGSSENEDEDAVPVVRCRDCRYCDPSNGIFWCDRFDSAVQIDGMAYCSYGKQKLKEDNQCSDT